MKIRTLFLLFTFGVSVLCAQTVRAQIQLQECDIFKATDKDGRLRTLRIVHVDEQPNLHGVSYLVGRFEFGWSGSQEYPRAHHVVGVFRGCYSNGQNSQARQVMELVGIGYFPDFASRVTCPKLKGHLYRDENSDQVVAVLETTEKAAGGETDQTEYVRADNTQ